MPPPRPAAEGLPGGTPVMLMHGRFAEPNQGPLAWVLSMTENEQVAVFHPKEWNTHLVAGTWTFKNRHTEQNFPFYIFWRNHGILFCFAWTQLKTVTEAEPWLGASHPPLGLWHPLPGALQWGMSTLREHTVLERQQQTPDVNEWLADDFWGGFRQRNRGSLQLTRRWCSPPCEWICFEKLRSIAGGCLANFLRALQKERGKRSTKSHLLLWNRVYQPTVTSYSPARCRH